MTFDIVVPHALYLSSFVGAIQYLIKWVDWPEDDATWESEDTLEVTATTTSFTRAL